MVEKFGRINAVEFELHNKTNFIRLRERRYFHTIVGSKPHFTGDFGCRLS